MESNFNSVTIETMDESEVEANVVKSRVREPRMKREDFFEKVLALDGMDEEMVKFAEIELKSIRAKMEASKAKRSETSHKNHELAREVLDLLSDKPMTATDIASNFEGMSVQKASTLCRILVENGTVEKVAVRIGSRLCNGYVRVVSE